MDVRARWISCVEFACTEFLVQAEDQSESGKLWREETREDKGEVVRCQQDQKGTNGSGLGGGYKERRNSIPEPKKVYVGRTLAVV